MLARGSCATLRRPNARRFVYAAAASSREKPPGKPARGGDDRSRRGASSSRDVVPRQRRNFDASHAEALEAHRARVNRGATPTVALARGKANMFLDGCPIVYAGAIEKIVGSPKTGDWVCVTDHALAPICVGFYNETSSYAVRAMAMCWEDAGEDEDAIVRRRIREAYDLRKSLGLVGSDRTTCYRLINSEGDRCSGLNADVYGRVVVASSTAAWAERRRNVVLKGIAEVLGNDTKVVWRRDEKMYEQEGEPWNGESVSYYHAATGEEISGDVPGEVHVLENGVKYVVDIAGGHKTGFYVDQRDNRAALRDMVKGKRVLDVCCYTGGFALNAALGGAASVTAVDSSESALACAAKNAELNGVADKIKFVRDDAFDYMQELLDSGAAGTYDVVVLDPPKFAPNKTALAKALPKYVGLNKRAMALLRPGGILITCSCSGAVTQDRLLPRLVEEASRASGRFATVLSYRGAGADQPVDPAYAFGEYLSVLTVRVA